MVVNPALIKHFDSMFALILRHHTQGPLEFLDLVASFLGRNSNFYETSHKGSWHTILLDIFIKNEPVPVHQELINAKAHEHWEKVQEVEKMQRVEKIITMRTKTPTTPIIPTKDPEIEARPEPIKRIKLDAPVKSYPGKSLKMIASHSQSRSQAISSPTNIVLNGSVESQKRTVGTLKYNQLAYERFLKWKKDKVLNEHLLMEYCEAMSGFNTQSQVMPLYKTLKTILTERGHVIESGGGKYLTYAQLNEFIQIAPNSKYLLDKVILIIGVRGRCETNELLNLKLSDVRELSQDCYHVTIRNANSKAGNEQDGRTFNIIGPFCEYIREYTSLRSNIVKGDSFFYYKNGSCMNVNNLVAELASKVIANCGHQVATFLQLENRSSYKCISFPETYNANKQFLNVNKGFCNMLHQNTGEKNVEQEQGNENTEGNNVEREDENTDENNAEEEQEDVVVMEEEHCVIDLDSDSDYEQDRELSDEALPAKTEEFTCEEENIIFM